MLLLTMNLTQECSVKEALFWFKQVLIYLSITFAAALGCDAGFDRVEPFLDVTNVYCYLKGHDRHKRLPKETKSLAAIGCGGLEPDLLLVYGPASCHLGFPAWRLRYTEFMHMGPLKSMKYGAIVKAFYNFSKKHQNYEDGKGENVVVNPCARAFRCCLPFHG